MSRVSRSCFRFCLIALALAPAPACAQSAEDFFKAAQLSMYVGSGGGGGYDAIARLVRS